MAHPALKRGGARMNVERLRAIVSTAEQKPAIARHCRELLRVARQPEIKEQLREWEQEIQAEAETAERSHHQPEHQRKA